MGNVLRILKRDILRLLKVPPAMVVIIALLILPSIYTWYNVLGFWNPYNNTGNLRVSVVNEDEGGSSELTGQLNVGDMIVSELEKNTQLDWVFTGYDEAMFDLESGSTYAVFVIPNDFTNDLLSLTTGTFVRPEIAYYVNEKSGPVAPKITDTGSNTLDETINSTFIKTVSETVVQSLDDKLRENNELSNQKRSEALSRIEDALNKIAEVQEIIRSASGNVSDLQGSISDVRNAVGSAESGMDSAAGVLATLSDLLADIQGDVKETSSLAMPAVVKSISHISKTSSYASEALGELKAPIAGANSEISNAVNSLNERLLSVQKELIDKLEKIDQSSLDEQKAQLLQETIALLKSLNEKTESNIAGLDNISNELSSTSDSIFNQVDSIDAAVQRSVASMQDYSDTLFGDVIPEFTSTMIELSSAASSASAAIDGQKYLIIQTYGVLDDLDSTLNTAKSALSETGGLLGSLYADLELIQSDIYALTGSDALRDLIGEDSLNAKQISEFMGSPTNLKTEQLYYVNAYGTSMAPLFMNLTFWIGAFMLMVILRQEVDSEGIRNITLTQRYLGRFLLLAIFVILQATICCLGLPFLGVYIANIPSLIVAAIIASLSYLSIIFALSITLQHIGKGICVVLVFAQIPGATGLYPIEMTSSFFQTIYPLLPFTYGINAMREAICGFYGFHYLEDVGVLILFFVAFMALGILVRPFMSNVNRMVARQIKLSGIFNGEDVEVPARRYKLSQVIRALSDKEKYRRELLVRWRKFQRLYPRLIWGAVIVGIAVPILLTAIFSLTISEKVVILTLWLVWMALVFIFLVVVESLRYSIERQMKLDVMSEDELMQLYYSRNRVENSSEHTAARKTKGSGRD